MSRVFHLDGNESSLSFGSMQDGFEHDVPIALTGVAVRGEVEGLLFTSHLCQEYKNESEENIECIYTFPLAWDTVLLGLSAVIGGRELTGHVLPKNEAEESYEEAVGRGDSAILVERSAKGLYTANLGNIKAGEKVTIELMCVKLLRPFEGTVRLTIPTVISERYGDPYTQGGLAPHESAKVSGEACYTFFLSLTLKGEIANLKVSSPSHALTFEKKEDELTLRLEKDAVLDRDCIVLLEGVSACSFARFVRLGEEYYALASFVPKITQKKASPVALKLLVDCSGSMQGERIAKAREGVGVILRSLTDGDSVSFSRFGSRVVRMTEGLLPYTENNCATLTDLVAQTSADLGGTEMEEAMRDTFAVCVPEGSAPLVLCITDGDVWEVEAIVRLAKASGHRVFAIGVGSAPAESLLRELAEQTGGGCEFVSSSESLQEAVGRLFSRMRGVIVTDVHVDWHCPTLWQSKPPRFLYNGETVHCVAKMAEKPAGLPTLAWSDENGSHEQPAPSVGESKKEDLARLVMARCLEECDSFAEKQEIGLRYQLVCEATSLVLVCEREKKCASLPRVQQIPQMVAAGHGLAGTFGASGLLRAAFPTDGCTADGAACLDDEPFEEVREPQALETIAELLSFWKDNLLQWKSLAESLQAAQKKGFDVLFRFLRALSSEQQISLEELWPLFLVWAFASNGQQTLDRHTQRLLSGQRSPAQEKIDACRARFEEWAEDCQA